MFRRSSETTQLNMFTSVKNMLTGASSEYYADSNCWHNIFRTHVVGCINEDLFKDIFDDKMGAPNQSIRVLVGMMALKEAFGWSDAQLFENARFNLLTRSALGIFNIDEKVPAESTYYLFRKRINDYQKSTNIDLMEKGFESVTSAQAVQFNVNGRSIRMDSKLIGSNISWGSRYEIIHQTISLFYRSLTDVARLKLVISDKPQLEALCSEQGNKVVYRSSREEVYSQLQSLGQLMYHLVSAFEIKDSEYYTTLKRVFEEQYKQDELKIVLRPKEEVKSDSVQSPGDPDCSYRKKDDQRVKGYSVNIAETCDDKSLNLITNVQVEPASATDNYYLINSIEKSKEVLGHKPENVHSDGAYNSQDNVKYCKKEDINFYLNGMQGKPGLYDLILNGSVLTITNTLTGEIVNAKATKHNKWGTKTEYGYRYFSQQEIDSCNLRKQINQIPYEKRNIRNNVEATIFQLSFHTRNNKTRYRGIIKTKMWSLARCLWINCVRIKNYVKQICQRTACLAKFSTQNQIFCIQNWIFNEIRQIFLSNKNYHLFLRIIPDNNQILNLYLL